MDQVFISGLIVHGILGVNDWEQDKPQEVRLDLILFGDLGEAAKSDDIRQSINYRTIAKKILAHAETARRLTAEALAADLARLCLEEPGVEKVRLRVERPGAMLISSQVGIEIEREKGAMK